MLKFIQAYFIGGLSNLLSLNASTATIVVHEAANNRLSSIEGLDNATEQLKNKASELSALLERFKI